MAASAQRCVELTCWVYPCCRGKEEACQVMHNYNGKEFVDEGVIVEEAPKADWVWRPASQLTGLKLVPKARPTLKERYFNRM